MKVEGIERVSYVSKKDGTLKEGINIFWTEPVPAESGEGLRCKSEYARKDIVEEYGLPEVGKSYRIFYNRYGSVDGWMSLDNRDC